jgi:DNA-binding NarL/FixJ family response regulator
MGPAAPIKVAIIEDQEKIRTGLAALISGTNGFACTGIWASVEEALTGLEGAEPDIVLVDIGLPGISGIEGIGMLKERRPSLSLLVLTVYEDDERIFGALCAGACGYLLKGTPPARLMESLSEAMAGGAPMSPQIARRVIQHFQSPRQLPASPAHDLTPHEIRILRLLVEGHYYQTAADELGVTVNTIRFHLRRIYEKLQVHSKAEAVAKALRERLVR